MGKICLTCEVTKSMNQAELEKVIPDWYKEIGNYSLLPPFLNNNDKYNANKRTLQIQKPNITNYEVNIKVEDKPNTWICYWAAEYTKDFMKIKSAKDAYNTFKNHGLVKTNSKGQATFVLNCPQPYSVDDITYPRHVHYCLLNRDNFWSDNIKTLIVSCKIDFKIMKKFVHDKCHILFNALPKNSFDRCHIPNSCSLPVSLLEKSSSKGKQNKVKHIIHKVLENYPPINKALESKKITIYNLPIVVYCAHSKCHASEKLIEHLIDAGFVNVLEYPGGNKEWKLKEKDSMPETCFFSDENHVGGGEIKEIKEKVTNWTYEVKNPEKEKGSKKSKSIKKTLKKDVTNNVTKTKTKKKKKKNEFDLEGQFEKLVYENIVYIHNIENNEILKNDKKVGVFNGLDIKWDSEKDKKEHILARNEYNDNIESSSEDESSSDESSDDETSSDDDTSSDEEEEKSSKKSEKTVKYRKHKLSLKCMSDITPKIYNEKFRGWGLTNWNIKID